MTGRQHPRQRGCGNWLLRGFISLFLILALILIGIPKVNAFWMKSGEFTAIAAEATLAFFQAPNFGPEHVHLSIYLKSLAELEGISEYDLRAIIAAAISEGISPEHLLGLAKVETSYCRNIGGGVAIDEVRKRMINAEPGLRDWWRANLDALAQIAANLGVEVTSIPGSIGAGAISCFQLMPSNWLAYGGGDYRQSYQAALNSARFLNAHGYQEDPIGAIRSYNYGAGDLYLNAVLSAASIWEFGVTTALITQPVKLKLSTLVMIYLEFLAWYTGDYLIAGPVGGVIVPIPADAIWVFPYPGAHSSSYNWLQPVYSNGVFLINHPGQDYVRDEDYWNIEGGPIVAAHSGVVTYAAYLPRYTALAAQWWISGNVVVIRSEFADGTPVCSLYGHGANGTMVVSVGQPVAAGQLLMNAGTTGFSTGVHLHLGVIVGGSGNFCDGGTWVDPNQFFS